MIDARWEMVNDWHDDDDDDDDDGDAAQNYRMSEAEELCAQIDTMMIMMHFKTAEC